MTGPRRMAPILAWTSILGLLTIGAWLMLGSGGAARNGAGLENIPTLLRTGRFDRVSEEADAYLAWHPGDPQAEIYRAMAELDRPEPRPQPSLERLEQLPETSDDAGTDALRHLYIGKALHLLHRYDAAETAWRKAIERDPRVPEAGWLLLGLYYVQKRPRDAMHLAVKLHEVEPDSRDRVRLLLELVRQEVQPPDPASIVLLYEPAVAADPQALRARIALGTAYLATSRIEEGLAHLAAVVEAHPRSLDAWEAWLTGLSDSTQFDRLESEWERVPGEWKTHPRIQAVRGRLAQERREWTTAAEAYEAALRADPFRGDLLYRLVQALRLAGRNEAMQAFVERSTVFEQARKRAFPLYEEASAIPDLGLVSRPDLYRELGALREGLGRREEARAWYRLALKAEPDDAVSKEALVRPERIP